MGFLTTDWTWLPYFGFYCNLEKLEVLGYRFEIFGHFYSTLAKYSFRQQMDEGCFKVWKLRHTALFTPEFSIEWKSETRRTGWLASIFYKMTEVVTIDNFVSLRSDFSGGSGSTFASRTFLRHFSEKRSQSPWGHFDKNQNEWSISTVALPL